MASNKRTIYLGLDYSQFTGGITEINRKMGLLDAEFKLATEQAKNYGTETDKTALKQEYLAQKIELQKKKVEEAEKAYNAVMSSQNASQKEIDALDKKLLQERTTLEKLNGELNDEKEATDKATKANKSFGDEIRDLSSALGVSASPAVEALAKKFDGVSASVGNAILVVGAIGGALVKAAKDTAEWADKLQTTADQTNITVEELQRLQYAAEFIDVDVETLTNSMEKMIRSMSQAQDGSGQAADAFKKLGIRVTDSYGHLRDQQEVFYETIDALGKVKNETERDAMAMEVFGKSARELNPLIKQGSQRLKELGDEAEALGQVFSSEEIAKAGDLQNAIDGLTKQGEALKKSLALSVIPILTGLFEAISKIPVPVLQTLVVLGTVVATIITVVKAIKSMTETASTIKNFFSTFDLSTLKTTAIILGVVAALIALAAIISILAGKGQEVQNTMVKVKDMTTSVADVVSNAQNRVNTTSRNASGTRNFSGGRTWVGEEGPELVTLPRGTKIEPTRESNKVEYNTFNITIDAKNVSDFNKVVELARNQRMAERRV